jgi:hypothetical protein
MAKSSYSTADVAATPAETLRGAAAYLADHGWTRGEPFDTTTTTTTTTTTDQPAACAYGAIRMATGGNPEAYVTPQQDVAIGRAMHALAIHLYPVYRPYHRDSACNPFIPAQRIVTGWNDRQTAADQVIAALRAAADDWDRHHHAHHSHRISGCTCPDCNRPRRAA